MIYFIYFHKLFIIKLFYMCSQIFSKLNIKIYVLLYYHKQWNVQFRCLLYV